MDKLIDKYILSEKLPKGWNKKSLEKFSKTIGKKPDEKGFFDL